MENEEGTLREPKRTGKAVCKLLLWFYNKRRKLRRRGKTITWVIIMVDGAGNMVLPFIPFTVSFQDVNYYVDTTPVRQ